MVNLVHRNIGIEHSLMLLVEVGQLLPLSHHNSSCLCPRRVQATTHSLTIFFLSLKITHQKYFSHRNLTLMYCVVR
jgi:hypothetical protein